MVCMELGLNKGSITRETLFERGEEVTIEIATLATGVLIMVGAIIAGGAIYAGLEKLTKAINKQK